MTTTATPADTCPSWCGFSDEHIIHAGTVGNVGDGESFVSLGLAPRMTHRPVVNVHVGSSWLLEQPDALKLADLLAHLDDWDDVIALTTLIRKAVKVARGEQ